jgi:hypothetical protein
MAYIVVINGEESNLYLAYETPGQIDPKTMKTIKEPMGHFSSDEKDAMKIRDESLAKAIAAAYPGAEVIKLKEAER